MLDHNGEVLDTSANDVHRQLLYYYDGYIALFFLPNNKMYTIIWRNTRLCNKKACLRSYYCFVQ